MHTVTPLKCRLAEIQLGHLPQQVVAHIERDLAGASVDEIAHRVTREYVVEATKEALKAMRRKTAPPPPPPVVELRPRASGQPRPSVRHTIVTVPQPFSAKELRARTRQLAIQMELCFPSSGARK